jgi:hypothetical protein
MRRLVHVTRRVLANNSEADGIPESALAHITN